MYMYKECPRDVRCRLFAAEDQQWQSSLSEPGFRMFQPGGDGFTLLVGEGNFSFAAALSKEHPNSRKCYATSYETANGCSAKYGKEEVAKNVDFLHSAGANVLFGVNATKLQETLYPRIDVKAFDLIIFQFPHTGRKASISDNRCLLRDFFCSAYDCLKSDTGRIVVTLCAGQGGTPADSVQRDHCNSWQVVEMAACSNLILTEVCAFDPTQFEGYLPTGRRNAGNAFITNQAMCHNFAAASPAPPLLPGWNSTPIKKCSKEGAVVPSYIKKRIDLMTKELDTMPQFLLEKELLQGLAIANEFNKRLQNIVDGSALLETSHLCKTMEDDKLNNGRWRRASLLVHIPAALRLMKDGAECFCYLHGIVFRPVRKEHIEFASPLSYQLMVLRKGTTEFDMLGKIENVVKRFSCRTTRVQVKVADAATSPLIHGLCKSTGLNVDEKRTHAICCVSHDEEMTIAWEYHIVETPGNVKSKVITLFDMDTLLMVVNPGIGKNLWSLNRATRLSLCKCLESRTEYAAKSLYPPSYRHDFSFWVSMKSGTKELDFDESDLVDIILSSVDDNVASLECLETYDKGDRTSLCYRIVYKSYDCPLSKDCSNKLQAILRKNLIKYLGVNLR